MATRADIRDAFLSELRSAAATSHTVTYGDGSTTTVTVDSDDVRLMDAEGLEALPGVVYTENYVPIGYNGAGAGPHDKTYDQNDDVVDEIWREYVEAQFVVQVYAGDEVVKEPIYEAVRSAFHKYHFDPWPESDLHPDVFDVEVRDSDSVDSGAAEDRVRGDELEVFVRFHRDYTFTTDNITQVDSNVEGTTYTTN